MIVLGIDPGTATVGFGIVAYERGNLTPIDTGVLLTPPEMPYPDRLHSIYTDILTLIDRYNPDTVATERLFFNQNVTTGIDVAGARGVILMAFAERNLPWTEYTPSQVKIAVTGYGRADKKQMQLNVTRLLNLTEIPRPDDAADALAVAICHAHSVRWNATERSSGFAVRGS